MNHSERMTEQERYTIEKDLVTEKLYIWDYDDPIGEIDDDKTLITLVNLLNKLNEENEKLKKRNKISLYKVCDLLNGLYEEIEELKEKEEVMEKVLENMGFTVEYDNKEKRWRIE